MLYYKTPSGAVFAYETVAERDTFGAPDLVPMTAGEVAAHILPAPPTVPQSVTRFQARAALARAGLFTTVNSAMVAFPIDDERRLAWEDAQEFRRTSPTMLQMAAALGLTDAQLDELFTTAAGIEA